MVEKRHDYCDMDEEIEEQACKFPRLGNNRNNSINKIASMKGYEKEEDGNKNHFQIQTSSWQNSSRIVRASKASGGKDRHSKVMTSKGLRDRRVRLSVTTAIQFYDLQDRLGYDQPSKAVEWLIKAASDSISELPSLNNTFPETPKQIGDENYQSQKQNLSLSKSACSSTSETSKGSGLSLSRSEIRVKARERARERATKEKEKEAQQNHHHHNVNVNHSASFTELLTGGHSHSLENQSDEMQQHQHFPFMHENLNHSSSSCSQLSESEYNLNFRISSGFAGYNRGPLQSNSQSLLPQLQRFSTIDGSSSTSNNHLPFFIGSSASTMDNNHHHLQFSPVFDGRLQLCYGDGSSLSDQKGKANKN